jgi:glycosyltransferase involved in cell wall biosynthesis
MMEAYLLSSFMGRARVGGKLPNNFRIGIWCDYGFTILPDEGIGVLIYNLVQGFLRQTEPIEVVLLVSPGDKKRVAGFTGSHERLHILTRLDSYPKSWSAANQLLKVWVAKSDQIHRRKNLLHDQVIRLRDRIKHFLGNQLKNCGRWLKSNPIPGVLVAAATIPIAGVALWATYALLRYGAATIQVLTWPLRFLDQALRRARSEFSIKEPRNSEIAQMAGCDAWIVPQVLLDQPLPYPSVVMIHDFVSSHFQELFERWYPGYHDRAKQLMPVRAREAAICLCMSNFIRDSDLLGVLKLPPSKVRVVRSAPPADLPELSVSPESLIPKTIQRPYIFFPTAFRPYKNHGGLVQAIRILRDRHQENSWDLVFTGEKLGYLPPELEQQIKDCNLQDRIRVLGRVDRQTLAALYRQAFATIVPSFYEQGSFQIYEALQAGCPVACSHIPPFLEQCGPMGDGMLYFDPGDPDAIAQTILTIRDQRENIQRSQRDTSRVLWKRTWDDVARDLIQICKEATPTYLRSATPESLTNSPHEVFLFLQIAYEGGVWETTKDLLQALVEINRERGQLILTVGIDEDQKDTAAIEQLAPDLSLERFRFGEISRHDGEWLLEKVGKCVPSNSPPRFSFMKGCESSALRADAWLALVDRFQAPLLPLRPYGVVVYDMIQRHLPQAFAPVFFQWVKEGMSPTIQNALVVLVTSPATREDVVTEYHLDPSRIQMTPVACEPDRRFNDLKCEHVPLPRDPFILCVANASEHKGADMLLRALALWKQKSTAKVPMFVFAGVRTDAMSPRYRGDREYYWWTKIRQLVSELGLIEDRDMTFLGFVNDSQLLDLYQRCNVVVNAAKHDNGSFSLIEGAYFGRPLVSSKYPAVEFLCRRFKIPVKYFPVDDHQSLASVLEQTMDEKPIQGAELQSVRQQLQATEFSYRLYAERIYDLLIRLAVKGRQERLSQISIRRNSLTKTEAA